MAIFSMRLFEFAPVGSTFDRGPGHRIQRQVMVVDDPPLNHDRYAIVSVDPRVLDHLKEYCLVEVCCIIVGDLEYELCHDLA